MTAIFFIVRLGSKRLKNKHLIKVKKKTLLEWLVGRYLEAFSNDIDDNTIKLFIVTSDEEQNYVLSEIFNNEPRINVYYGDTYNIPKRIASCAKKYDIDNIISIDGDDILCSTDSSKYIYERLSNGISYLKTDHLPLGMNSMGFTYEHLVKSLKKYHDDILETGWSKIFNTNSSKQIKVTHPNSKLRLTLDYQQDAIFFGKIISHFEDEIFKTTDKEIISFIKENKLFEINSCVNENYWENFKKELDKENGQ